MTMEKLTRALKNSKSTGENKSRSELYKSLGELFHQRLLVFNNICICEKYWKIKKKGIFITTTRKVTNKW